MALAFGRRAGDARAQTASVERAQGAFVRGSRGNCGIRHIRLASVAECALNRSPPPSSSHGDAPSERIRGRQWHLREAVAPGMRTSNSTSARPLLSAVAVATSVPSITNVSTAPAATFRTENGWLALRCGLMRLRCRSHDERGGGDERARHTDPIAASRERQEHW